MSVNARAIVVGGGLAGLAAGRALLRSGFKSVQVLESAPSAEDCARRGTNSMIIPPNGMTGLYHLGVLDRAISHGRIAARVVTKDLRNDTLMTVTVPMLSSTKNLHAEVPEGLLLTRKVDLMKILSRDLHVKYGVRVAAVELPDKDRVLVKTSTESEPLEADLVIGADGFESLVRRQIASVIGGNTLVKKDQDQVRSIPAFWLSGEAVAPNPHSPSLSHAVTDVWGDGTRFSLGYTAVASHSNPSSPPQTASSRALWQAAVTHNRLAAILKGKGKSPEEFLSQIPLDPSTLSEQIFRDFPSYVKQVMEHTRAEDIRWGRIKHRVTDKELWAHGRLALIGDAAHVLTPDLWQGGSLALEEAATLSLALQEFSGNIPQALLAYRECRFARAEAIAQAAVSESENSLAGGLWSRLRDFVTGLLPRQVAQESLARFWTADPARDFEQWLEHDRIRRTSSSSSSSSSQQTIAQTSAQKQTSQT